MLRKARTETLPSIACRNTGGQHTTSSRSAAGHSFACHPASRPVTSKAPLFSRFFLLEGFRLGSNSGLVGVSRSWLETDRVISNQYLYLPGKRSLLFCRPCLSPPLRPRPQVCVQPGVLRPNSECRRSGWKYVRQPGPVWPHRDSVLPALHLPD